MSLFLYRRIFLANSSGRLTNQRERNDNNIKRNLNEILKVEIKLHANLNHEHPGRALEQIHLLAHLSKFLPIKVLSNYKLTNERLSTGNVTIL